MNLNHARSILCVLLTSALWVSCKAQTGSDGNLGGGTTTSFTEPSLLQISAPGGYPAAIDLVIGKFNNDDYADLAMLTDQGVLVYLNQGGTTWSGPVAISETLTAHYSVGVGADLDGDSKSLWDLILFRQNSQLEIFQNNGSGAFSRVGTQPQSGILNSLAYAAAKTSGANQGIIFGVTSATNHFYYKQTSFGFSSVYAMDNASALSPTKVLAGDVNEDGYRDIVLVPSTSGSNVLVYKNTSDSGLDSPLGFSRYSAATNDAVLKDVDKDGHLDLLIAGDSGLELYLGTGSLTGFSLSSVLNPSTYSVVATSVVVGDVTGDGKNDLFMSRSGKTPVLYTQSSALSFSDIASTAFVSGALSRTTSKVYAADIDGDGILDLLELKSDGSIAIHINSFSP